MNWTTVQDLKQQVLRLWLRGDLLRALATGEPWEPRRLALKAPDTRQLSEHFEDVRRWVAELGAVGGGFVFSGGTPTIGLSACSGCLRLCGWTPPTMPLR